MGSTDNEMRSGTTTRSSGETPEQIAKRILSPTVNKVAPAVYRDLVASFVSALRNASNKTCPECATVAPEGSGYCGTCDTFTMPSDFSLRLVRRTKMEEVLRNERERCAKIAERKAGKNKTIGDTKAIARAIREGRHLDG